MAKKTTIYVQQEETFVRRRQTVIKVEASYVQLYKNIRAYTLALSPGSPIDMMLFFITKMNDNNGIQLNKTLIDEYIKSLPTPITERTFYRTVKILTKNNVLLPISRGEYKMNPAIVWQGDVGTRMEHIKFLEEGGVSLKPNEKLLFDKREDSQGNVTVLGNEESAKEEMVIDFGPAEEIMQAVNVITGQGERNYPQQTIVERNKLENARENNGKIGTNLNTHGTEQGQWDAPLDYPKPKIDDFQA